MAKWLLGLGLALLSAPIWAASPGAAPYRYHARQWSVEQGLPQVTVTAIAQDRRGFIWVGTQNGLARFDGTRFEIFASSSHPRLHGDRINALAVDGAGRLWIAGNKGLSAWIQGRLAQLPAVSGGLGEVNALATSGDDVWIAAEHGLFHVGKGQLRARAVPGWPAHGADSVAVGPQGRLWVAVKGGIYARDAGDDAFRFHPLPDKALSVYALAWFHGRLWVGTSRGLYRMDHGRLQATRPRLAKRSIRALLTRGSRFLWIGTDASLFRLDAHDRLVDFSVTPGLQDQWIWSLAADRAGDIWIGTATRGMVRLWDNHVAWFGGASGLADSLVTAVYRDTDGSLLVGAKAGVYRYRAGNFKLLYGQADLPSTLIHGFLRRRNGQLWIATVGGLALMQSGHAVELPAALAPLQHANVYHLRRDGDGTLWIGTRHGLYRYRDGRLLRFGKDDGLTQDFVRSTYRFGHGPLWVATTRGLFRFAQARFRRVCGAQGLHGQVLHVAHDAGGIWIAVADGSLFRYAAGQCTRHTFAAAPLAGSLYYVAPDHHGTLWLSNDRGVYRVAVSRLDAIASGDVQPERLIQSADGVHRIHPVGGTAQTGLLEADGHFWVPTVNGLLALNIHDPPAAATAAPVVIERISRENHTLSLRQPPAPVTFQPGRNDLRIDYAALDYRTPESVRYQYRLSGYDTGWADAGSRQEALYTHLPPGRYTFQVRTDDAAGADTRAQTAELHLVLQPYFYQTRWFHLLLALVAACLAYVAYAVRMRRVRARQQALETLIATRTEELRDANRRLRRASTTDPLTGLKNRRFFVDAVNRDVAALRRDPAAGTREHTLVFLILDLDDFKRINDSHGHQAGDAVLVQLGELLRHQVRTSDDVIRWGGEEFLIVARQTDAARAAALAESLRASIAAHAFDVGDSATAACTCSIGFCAFPFVPGNLDHPDWEGVLNLADAALYRAKHSGKDTWVGVKYTGTTLTDDSIAPKPELDTLLRHGVAELDIRVHEKLVGAVASS